MTYDPHLRGRDVLPPAGLTPATLAGTGLLADDLYLMSHDDVTGRPFLHPRALGLGLAGGLLAELLLSGRLSLRQGRMVVSDAGAPADILGRCVLGHVLTERQTYSVSDWLAYLARTSITDVAVRLELAGYLIRKPARRPWRAQRWVPADPDCAFASLCRARAAVEESRSATVHGVALAGFAVACGLAPRLLSYSVTHDRRRLDHVVAQLAPGLPALIAQTQAAVDSALLSHWA